MITTIIGTRIYTVPYRDGMSVYVRFGRWNRKSRNAMTGEKEIGVSVYPAKCESRIISINPADLSPQLNGAGRLIFPVTGKLLGFGADAEPLLGAVRMVTGVAIDLQSIPNEVRHG